MKGHTIDAHDSLKRHWLGIGDNRHILQEQDETNQSLSDLHSPSKKDNPRKPSVVKEGVGLGLVLIPVISLLSFSTPMSSIVVTGKLFPSFWVLKSTDKVCICVAGPTILFSRLLCFAFACMQLARKGHPICLL